MIKKVDVYLWGIGAIMGYFFVDFLRSTVRLLTSLPPLLIFLIGLGAFLYLGKHPPIRVPADLLMGLGVGLALRGETLSG